MEHEIVGAEAVETQRESSFSVKGLYQVFINPGEFFAKLKNRPKVLVPYIALAILSAAMMFLLKDLILQVQLATPEAQARLQGQELPPKVMAIQSLIVAVSGTISMLLIPLLTGALAWFWGNFVFALKASFKQVLSVVLYGEILYVIGGLLHVPVMLAQDSFRFTLSLAVLVPHEPVTSALYVLLSKFSLFLIWEIVVVGIGFAAIYSVNRNKGYLLAVLSIGLLSAIHIGWTALAKLMF